MKIMKNTDINMIKNLPNHPFTLKETTSLGVTRYMIAKAIKSGIIQKLDHGLYKKIQKQQNQIFDTSKFEKVSGRAKDPSCVCLWSALYYYDLTDEIVDRVWIYVPYSKVIRDKDARIVRKRAADWKSGITKKDGFKITSIERTIIDCFLSKKHISLKDSINIARASIKNKKTTLNKLVSMTKEMGVFDKLKEHLGLII